MKGKFDFLEIQALDFGFQFLELKCNTTLPFACLKTEVSMGRNFWQQVIRHCVG